jgi:hypothetical protein
VVIVVAKERGIVRWLGPVPLVMARPSPGRAQAYDIVGGSIGHEVLMQAVRRQRPDVFAAARWLTQGAAKLRLNWAAAISIARSFNPRVHGSCFRSGKLA